MRLVILTKILLIILEKLVKMFQNKKWFNMLEILYYDNYLIKKYICRNFIYVWNTMLIIITSLFIFKILIILCIVFKSIFVFYNILNLKLSHLKFQKF